MSKNDGKPFAELPLVQLIPNMLTIAAICAGLSAIRFASQTIPATVSEAPYILDGLLNNEMGKRIKEQYADTGRFTDHVFAVTSILGHRFIPRIRDLPSKRFYVFDPGGNPPNVKGMVGGKIREELIASNWPDKLRIAATMTAGTIAPSQILRKLSSYSAPSRSRPHYRQTAA